jgi:hypothetical protein
MAPPTRPPPLARERVRVRALEDRAMTTIARPLGALLVLLLLLAPLGSCKTAPIELLRVSLDPPISESAEGLHKITFDRIEGRVVLRIPDEPAAGDVLTGTVVAESKGTTAEERRENAGVLSGYNVAIEEASTTVSGRVLRWTVSAALAGGAAAVALRDGSGKELARAPLPVNPARPQVTPSAPPASADFELGNFAQAGHPLEIPGRFDGDFANTKLTLGGQPLELIAERGAPGGGPAGALIAAVPSDASGVSDLALREGDARVVEPIHVVAPQLSAEKLELHPGESTVFRCRLPDLQQLAEPISLALANATPTIVHMQGGDAQTLTIAPEDVPADGVYELQRTLTGTPITGPFSITASLLPTAFLNDKWDALKELASDRESFGRFIDAVIADLDAYAAAGGMTAREKLDVQTQLEGCKETARTDLANAKLCADRLLLNRVTVKQLMGLWVTGVRTYGYAIEAILGALAGEHEIPWTAINKTLEFSIEGADAAKSGADAETKERIDADLEKLRKAKQLKEAVEKGKETLENLTSALKQLLPKKEE